MKPIFLFLFLSGYSFLNAQKYTDGLYLNDRNGTDSVICVWMPDQFTHKLIFDDSVKIKWKELHIFSVNNENTEFYAYFIFSPMKDSLKNYSLMLDDTLYGYGGSGKSNEEYHTQFNLDERRARLLGKVMNTEVKYRKHPGHQFELQFITDKEKYKVGDTVNVNFVVKNTGKNTVLYGHGGAYRNATGRNDNFMFTATLNGDTLPDCCASMCFGGLFSYQPLASGASDTIQECVSKWISFNRPGIYEITGSYHFALEHEKENREYPWDAHLIWSDEPRTVFTVVVE